MKKLGASVSIVFIRLERCYRESQQDFGHDVSLRQYH